MSRLKADGEPIYGAAMLLGNEDEDGLDAVTLAVRVPKSMAHLATVIIRDMEPRYSGLN